MEFTKASKLDRKSGVRLGERGAPVQFPGWGSLPIVGDYPMLESVGYFIEGYGEGHCQEACSQGSGQVELLHGYGEESAQASGLHQVLGYQGY